MEDPKPVESVGAPTALADAEEMPNWVGDILKALAAAPILIGFLCGGIPLLCVASWCVMTFIANR